LLKLKERMTVRKTGKEGDPRIKATSRWFHLKSGAKKGIAMLPV